MLKYAFVPLVLSLLVGCAKKEGTRKAFPFDDNAHSGHSKTVEMGMNEYYGCPSKGPIAVINFDYDKSVLSDKAKEVLNEAFVNCIESHLSNNPDVKLLITGHTDRHGTVEYNVALGARRSYTTFHEFVEIAKKHDAESHNDSADGKNAVDSHSDEATMVRKTMCATSKGKEELLYSDDMSDADAKNRRVVLEFVPKADCK